jgi:hypothetical protein
MTANIFYTYLDDQVFHSVTVLRVIRTELRLQLAQSELLDVLNTDFTLFHEGEFVLVAFFRLGDLGIGLHLLNTLVVVELCQVETTLDFLAFFSLEVSLGLHGDFEAALVGLGPHHALELEGILVQLAYAM